MATEIRVPLAELGLPGQIRFKNDRQVDLCMQSVLNQLSEAEKLELARVLVTGHTGTPIQRKAAELVINWLASRR